MSDQKITEASLADFLNFACNNAGPLAVGWIFNAQPFGPATPITPHKIPHPDTTPPQSIHSAIAHSRQR
jgi:hypothetical protein